MNKLVVIGIVAVSLSVYFSMTVFVLPEKFLDKEQFTPVPHLEVEIPSTEIKLGESFRVNTISENTGDYGDIHIVSAAFPTLTKTDGIVRIVTYDFSNSPIYINPGDEIGAKYSGGLETVVAQYPQIEAMNRPVHPGTKYFMDFQVTPEEPGPFTVYLKSIDIPHTSSLSHFPTQGQLDHQEEYVLVYTVNVNP
ncbi:MAG: hypothetical protein H2B05_05520 [Nitrosopumilaceae archaeon]|uniref:Uncharacterized protein n=1 Tax=Candidatus Nitrosomaritimum aestuariumsis TaxID=3342354 RepID=A0AC60W3U0_9ARCH|nr:hypothetical protein [Nitrosopumilaceae archaeon]MBA4460902.1 hypothetical protein [Nitrosopumilaceae archaeon]